MKSLVATAIAQRHALHRLAELSNHETRTSEFVQGFLQGCHPTKIYNHVGGHGVLAVFGKKNAEPTTLFRAELDALPISESNDKPYSSQNPEVSHRCGHDGHMAILCGLAQYLRDHPVKKGRVVLLFQPAEETGEGCLRVLDNKNFQSLGPMTCFALHNLPGFASGEVVVRNQTFAGASTGFVINLEGTTSHAAERHHVLSPTRAVAQLLTTLPSVPQNQSELLESAQVTVIYTRLGQVSFGTSPGDADIMLTLRAETDRLLDRLLAECTKIVKAVATTYTLKCEVSTTERFSATINHKPEVLRITQAAERAKVSTQEIASHFAWSEDFGHLLKQHCGALFGIGAGLDHPALHFPDYDFPDEIIEPALRVFIELLRTEHY